MKRISIIMLLLCSAFFLAAQNESQLQNLLDKGLLTHDQLAKDFPSIIDTKTTTDCEGLLDSTVYKYNLEGVLNYNRREIFEYDEQNRETFQSIEYLVNTDDDFILRNTYESEYSGNESIILRERYDEELDELVPFSKKTTVFNADNQPESYEEDWYSQSSGDYLPSFRSDYTYTNSGLFENQNTERWNLFDLEYDSYRTRTYFRNENDETVIDSIVYKSYDIDTEALLPSWSLHLSYDVEGRLTEVHDYRIDFATNEFRLLLRDSTVYESGSDNFVRYRFRDPINSLTVLPLDEIRYATFENGLNTIDSIYQDIETLGEFVLSNIINYEYDEEGRRTKRMTHTRMPSGEFEITTERSDFFSECMTSLTIDEENSIECNIPNPFYNGQSITCTLKDNKDYQLRIYDLLGRKISERMIRSRESVSFEKLPNNGVYFMSIKDGNNILMQRKIIVSN